MTHRIFLFLALFALAFTSAQPANANWLEFFFPSLRGTADDPAQTLTAPFAIQEESAQGAAAATVTSPLNAIPLHSPHRPSADIAEWIVTIVSEAMTFDAGASVDANAQNIVHFDEKARDQYNAFLETHKILNVLKSNKFDVRNIKFIRL